jgi:hypothetical protein
MMKRVWCLALVSLVGLLSLGGITQGQADDPDKVDIRGTIKRATADEKANEVGSLLVVGALEKDTAYEQAIVSITKDTKIEILEGKDRKPAAFKDLKEGVRIQATFVGAVVRPTPVLATAGSILILPAKK